MDGRRGIEREGTRFTAKIGWHGRFDTLLRAMRFFATSFRFFFLLMAIFARFRTTFFLFFFLANILGISRGNTRARRFLFIYFFFLACWETIFCNRELLSSAPSEREHDCTKIDRIRVDRISFV